MQGTLHLRSVHPAPHFTPTWQPRRARNLAKKNFDNTSHIQNLTPTVRIQFVSMQNHYNLVYREEEREMIPLCLDQGVGLIPWSPLARGFLTGNRSRDEKGPTRRSNNDPFAQDWYFLEEDFAVVDNLLEFAAERGETPAALALAWILSMPGVTSPIIGSTKVMNSRKLAMNSNPALQSKASTNRIH